MKHILMLLTVFVIVMSPCFPNQNGPKKKEYNGLVGLQKHLQRAVLQSMETGKHPGYKPIYTEIEKLIRGNAREQDIQQIKEYAVKTLRNKAKSHRETHRVSVIGTLLYFFEGDLSVYKMYSEHTGRAPASLLFYFFGKDGSVHKQLLEDIDPITLRAYIAGTLIQQMVSKLEKFYVGFPKFKINNMINSYSLRILAALPKNAKRDRLLLNYPFEISGAIWQQYAYPEKMQKRMKMWPKRLRKLRETPKNIFKWYYREVIQQAGLEKEFMKQLELRNMTDVIPDKLKPQK